MADINYYRVVLEDTSESRGCRVEDGNCEENYFSDDNLTALQKLEKYIDSDNAFSRQLIARGILDTLRAAGNVEEDCLAVLKAMVHLSKDPEPTVRSDLVEQVPHVAMYCQEKSNLFANAVPTYILPLIVKYLSDSDNQVRKTSHAALVVLLEQELVERVDVEDQVVQVLLDLACPTSPDEFRTEAAALMCKMAPLLGREMTERLFLARFTQMCSDPLFHVRRICASNFGEICTVVGGESTEQNLLEKFGSLCEDSVWGVRKGCAESFMPLASICSVDVRRNVLTSLFVSLLCDQSRWVRMSAFQELGPFIYTFSSPNNDSGVYISEDGMLHVSEDVAERNLTDAEKEAKICCDRANETKQPSPSVEVDDEPKVETDNSSSQTSEYSQSCDKASVEICDKPSSPANIVDMQIDAAEPAAEASELTEIRLYTEEISIEEKKAKSIQSTIAALKSDATCTSEGDQSELSAEPTSSEEQQQQPESSSEMNIPPPPPTQTSDPTSSEVFNAFQYWRTPLPDIANVDLDLAASNNSKDDSNSADNLYASKLTHQDQDSNSTWWSGDLLSSLANMDLSKFWQVPSDLQWVNSAAEVERSAARIIHTASISTVYNPSETVSNIGSTHLFGHHVNESAKAMGDCYSSDTNLHQSYEGNSANADYPCARITKLSAQQEIVPPSLLQRFLTMVDPALSQTVDSEITRHCAYSFPAVAYTLGRHNWHCLKSLFETLAADMQWKVRRTLAFSIHKLAVILGEDITHKDLVPVFDGFLKDLDEVRIGVLKHLMEFLKLLKPSVRNAYLPKFDNFLTTDNHRNWRFRLELAEQCELLSSLFQAEENSTFLLPIALTLLSDKVAEVRLAACALASTLLKQLYNTREQYYQRMVNDLVECFATYPNWVKRQVYAHLCWSILEDNSIPPERFAVDFLPSLLDLATDIIPNVRITSSKTLSQCVLSVDYLVSRKNPHYERLVETMLKLQVDKDKDVRYFSALAPNKFQEDSHEENTCQDTVPV
ncbi:serine/threonine-protein phosphatase 4 regulatory subunit 1-like isoform X2 [Octopus vulgaris]|uniref:Serine/threonine-protein phosphatase 4 regulatory subunit 1-like isoform X2 n=2 Tax=Octopus TaxID=6643 RepID=A0AA36EWL0_OCTVU|nr:serine/threonine-protein phosphatase 4 regulatory subunit 1 isoform X2 [Octopus sinensis]CAI9715732.1 serine/threonine-protein phosphatase 4 regulatory subunit 1-like isoform X2 [Octopus vulgaris]